MLLETLLWNGFVGRSKLSDEGLSAIVQAEEPDATIVFKIDTPTFRDAMNLRESALCDGLFMGLSRPAGNEPRIHCLFVELKGRNVARAVEQLAAAMGAVRAHLARVLSPLAFGRTRFSAVIVSDRASPGAAVPREDILRFQRDFRSPIHICAGQREGASADLTHNLWRR